MKSTLSDIKYLFNVKAIAYNTNVSALTEGQWGIFAEGSDVSVASGTVQATLPAKFRIISFINGKLNFSPDIEKTRMYNQVAKAYQTEQVNIWEGTITTACDCINGVTLNVNVDEQSLIQRDGLTWTHRDFVVAVSPKELACACTCDSKNPVYENNVMTKLLYDKVIALNSPFYTAGIKVAVTGLTTYANQGALDTAVPSPATGALAIVTGAGLKQYNGTAWAVIATTTGVMTPTQADTFIAVNKALNTDDDATNDLRNLTLVIQGKPQSAGTYRDLEVNYVYPRGVKINPAISINGVVGIQFTETQALRYEVGAGYDLRAEEWDNMSNTGTLNHYTRLSDGIQAPGLVYQFANATNYSTVTFEFGSKKSGLEDVPEGDHKKFAVLLGTSVGGVYTDLQALFIPA